MEKGKNEEQSGKLIMGFKILYSREGTVGGRCIFKHLHQLTLTNRGLGKTLWPKAAWRRTGSWWSSGESCRGADLSQQVGEIWSCMGMSMSITPFLPFD